MSIGRAGPLRTCVGCRARAAKTDLLRVVMIEDVVVPDPRGRLPGRGAHLHPDLRCLDRAERRRAFARAFRLSGSPDPRRVRDYLEAMATEQQISERDEHRVGSGS